MNEEAVPERQHLAGILMPATVIEHSPVARNVNSWYNAVTTHNDKTFHKLKKEALTYKKTGKGDKEDLITAVHEYLDRQQRLGDEYFGVKTAVIKALAAQQIILAHAEKDLNFEDRLEAVDAIAGLEQVLERIKHQRTASRHCTTYMHAIYDSLLTT